MTDVIPAIIPESYDDITALASRVRGLVSRVQLDVADGTFAPSRTWPYESDEHFADIVAQTEGLPLWDEMDYEVDLLLREPERVIDDWIAAGVVAAVVYIESTKKLDDIIEKLRAANVSIGLGILPHTPLADVYACLEKNPAIYRPKTSDISPKNQRYIEGGGVFVQHMGSDDIGYHGVELDPVVYDRVREIRAKYPEIPIAVDIGVNEETAPKLVEAGVTKLVSGSTIFGSENIADTVEYLKNL